MTLNQKYKSSGSPLTFKEWVFEQQKDGALDFDSFQFAANSDKQKIAVAGIPIIYLGIGIIVILGALYLIPKLRK